MERWIRYKDNIINIAQVSSFDVRRMPTSKDGMQGMYSDDLKPTKSKPWMLFAGHHGIEVFQKKPEALELAERIVRGDYDIK